MKAGGGSASDAPALSASSGTDLTPLENGACGRVSDPEGRTPGSPKNQRFAGGKIDS